MKDNSMLLNTDLYVADKLGIKSGLLTEKIIEEKQFEIIRGLLRYARSNSPYYEGSLKDIDIDRIKTSEDFARLPTICEGDLVGNEGRFLCVKPKDVTRIVTVPTTGTAGQQKRISFSEKDLRSSMGFILAGFRQMCEPGDRMLMMMSGATTGSIGDVVSKALKTFGVEVKIYGNVIDPEEAYNVISSYKPQIIVGVPCPTVGILRYGERFGNPERDYIRSVLLSADDIPESIYNRIMKGWNCKVFRHYGMTEMGIAGGVECNGHDGYHLRSCDLYFEIDNPDEEGWGEVLLTTINREVMPLIRYRTGDIGRFLDGECSCGSKLKRLDWLKGRKNNSYDFGKGRVFLSEIENALFSDPAVIDFDAVAEGNSLTVSLKVFSGEKADTGAVQRALKEISGLKEADIHLSEERFHMFSKEYNAKKRIGMDGV